MKALGWLVGIVVLAVALTLAARYNTGYVLVVSPPYRVELSLNLAALLLIAGFVAVYALVRFVLAALRLPGEVRAYRLARRREKARQTLLAALREYFAGRYARAERAAAAALDLDEQPALSALLAARAAHELRARERRDAYLARAAAAAAGADEAPHVVTAAELLLEERRHEEALELLKRLPRLHTAALRLELKAQQRAHNWGEVARLAEALRRRNVFDATQADEVRRYALIEELKRRASDAALLRQAWEGLPAPDRRDRRIAAAAAQCFIALGDCGRAHRIVEEALEAEWDSPLAQLYSECEGGDAVKRIERAEVWLQRHPDDPALLLTLGRLCAECGLWGKAQSYLEASLAIEPTFTAHLAAARLQERLENAEAAARHYRASLDLALAQLKAVTGGRRRAAL